jgi:hypothetical protein
LFGGVSPFEKAGEHGELGGDFAGDLGGVACGVEGVRVKPKGAKTLADVRVGEVIEKDAIAARIGEREIGFASQGEVGEELDGVTDVYGDEEWRPAFEGGKSFGVAFGLVVSEEHGLVPAVCAANGGAATAAFGTR